MVSKWRPSTESPHIAHFNHFIFVSVMSIKRGAHSGVTNVQV